MFLMRCLFTMFAENVGLLPENSFKDVLARCEQSPEAFPHDVGQLWEAMDLGTWAHALRQKVPRFNGEFFRNRAALPLAREEIGELRQAASYNWRNVDPSIFGTLLEQALDPDERRKLGAHYTPRAYVERLVAATDHRAVAVRVGECRLDRRAPEVGRPRQGRARDGPQLPRQAVRDARTRSGLRHREISSMFRSK